MADEQPDAADVRVRTYALRLMEATFVKGWESTGRTLATRIAPAVLLLLGTVFVAFGAKAGFDIVNATANVGAGLSTFLGSLRWAVALWFSGVLWALYGAGYQVWKDDQARAASAAVALREENAKREAAEAGLAKKSQVPYEVQHALGQTRAAKWTLRGVAIDGVEFLRRYRPRLEQLHGVELIELWTSEMTRRNFDYPQRPDDQRSNGEFHQFRDKFFAQLMSAEVVRQHPNGTHLHQLAPLATKVLALADSESAVT